MRVIALEEHFRTPEGFEALGTDSFRFSPLLRSKLLDLGNGRLADMDAAGIDLQVLGAGGPAFQTLEAAASVSAARRANDQLAEAIAANPDRFAGFANLPTPDPLAAAQELERTVREFGFKGAMIHGHTQGRFLDDKDFWPIFEVAESLDVPIYLHPTLPPRVVKDAYYRGLDDRAALILATGAWGWHVDTGMHAFRLILGGVFDRFPRLQVILGHMGEGIPFFLGRAQAHLESVTSALERSITQYFCENFYVTTSGFLTHPPLLCSLMVVGADRIMFSVDYPYEDNVASREFLMTAPISPSDLEKLAHGNVERLLHLEPSSN